MKYFQMLHFYIQLMCVTFLAYGSELNHSEAVLKCADRGGLESNEGYIKNNGYIVLNSSVSASFELQEGESAWILGYAEYTKFMSWQGCYTETGKTVIKFDWKNGFTECFQFCDQFRNSKTITYIGFRENNCYCLETNDIRNLDIIPDINCSQPQPYNIKFNNTKDTRAISVFFLSKETLFQNIESNLNQCVYAENVPGSPRYGAISCYTRSNDIGGFICTNSAYGKLNKTCQNSIGDETVQAFCLEHHRTNWLSARVDCISYTGKLINYVLGTMQNHMTRKKKYWTGIFRSFSIVRNTSRVREVPTACLAVTRVDNKLVLDPDDCSTGKKYLCSDWGKHSVTTSTVPVISSSAEKNNTGHKWIYIVVAVAFVAIVAAVACVAVRRFRKQTEHKILRENTSTSFNNEDDAPADVSTANDNYATSELRNNKDKIKPKKPIRQTLRKQTCNTTYENFKLKSNASGDSENAARKDSEDYDKVDLKHGKIKLLDGYETGESHIYDHTTVEDGCENYDTIKSTKAHHQLDCVTYSTLQRKCDNSSGNNEQFLVREDDIPTGDEAHDNNAYDAMGEINTNVIRNVLPSDAEENDIENVLPSDAEENEIENVLHSKVEENGIENVLPSDVEENKVENVLPSEVEDGQLIDIN